MNKQIVLNFIISVSDTINLESVSLRLKYVAYVIGGSEKVQSVEDLKYTRAYNELKD